jgi:hypothetical protein
MKKIIVSSLNPVKSDAVEQGFNRMFPQEKFEIFQISVESGVSDQPMTDIEAREGAFNRAVNARKAAPDGSHLHFEVRLDVNDYAHTTNPVLWFSPVTMPEGGQSSLLAGVILDKSGNPVSQFQISLENLDEVGEVEAYYYPVTYYPAGVNSHPVLQENFTVADLPPGDYRLAFIYDRFYEVYFTLEPGELGFIKLQLD